MVLTQLLDKPLYDVVSKNIVKLSSKESALNAIKKMKSNNTRYVLIIHNGEAVGVVTKTDILFKVIYQRIDPVTIMVRDIMSSPVITLPASAKISDAINIMNKHTIRQIFVGSDTSIVGVITRDMLFDLIYDTSIKSKSKEIIDKIKLQVNNDELRCPYCDSIFEYKDELSKHIDEIHIGKGVLEGDLRKVF
jgi:CBS domain-containing protein/uncharacterized C2H2 Zn-finger protein